MVVARLHTVVRVLRRLSTVAPLALQASLGLSFAFPAYGAESPAVPLEVRAVAKGHGWLFTDATGRTLYSLATDEKSPGNSACNEKCAVEWPPLRPSDDAHSVAAWSIILRKDGSRQWAFRQMPLHTFAKDPGPGYTFGEAVRYWSAAFEPIAMPSDFSVAKTSLGYVLATAAGLTLYSKTGSGDCTGQCLDNWRPLLAPWAAKATDDWSIIDLKNGNRQWAYKGKALFHQVIDLGPPILVGKHGDNWQAVVLEPPPPRPSWVMVQSTDTGDMLADQQSKTIYAYSNMAGGDDCADGDWIPRYADSDAHPIGDWTVIPGKGGRKQWAYRGMRLYANAMDRWPGDFRGVRFGGDPSFQVFLVSEQPIQALGGIGSNAVAPQLIERNSACASP